VQYQYLSSLVEHRISIIKQIEYNMSERKVNYPVMIKVKSPNHSKAFHITVAYFRNISLEEKNQIKQYLYSNYTGDIEYTLCITGSYGRCRESSKSVRIHTTPDIVSHIQQDLVEQGYNHFDARAPHIEVGNPCIDDNDIVNKLGWKINESIDLQFEWLK
jgi:hypothetical protein